MLPPVCSWEGKAGPVKGEGRGEHTIHRQTIESDTTAAVVLCRSCVVYWGECQHLGEHECRCLLNRCENTEQLNKEASDMLLLGLKVGAARQAAVRVPVPPASTNSVPAAGGTGAWDMTLSSFATPLTPAECVTDLPLPPLL